MNFVVFPVGATNIFPLVNDKANDGQSMTEYNLRSRESVGTDQNVNYYIGPSYTHGADDFWIEIQQDDVGSVISSSTLQIKAGRAVINGHFIECFSDITIDLLNANAQAKLADKEPLNGSLVVGLRAMYSTLPTMAGSMVADNEYSMYEGVQVVILPPDEFKLPSDVPNDPDQVTAHLKLGTFNFTNNAINTVVNNVPDKTEYIEASRISNVEDLLSDIYITKSKLNPKKLYVFSGKGTDEVSGYDTWCEANDSLMVWDNNPQLSLSKPSLNEAAFGTNTNGKTQLAIPHKQVDGMVDTEGDAQYYATKILDLPLADFNSGTSGTVSKSYTDNIKYIRNQLYNIYEMTSGTQVGYIDVLAFKEDLPTINNNWNVGDYIMVNQDCTIGVADSTRPPTTLYVVLPGYVTEYKFYSTVKNSSTVPSALTGVELGKDVRYEDNGDTVDTTDPEVYLTYFDLNSTIRGQVGIDYFLIEYHHSEESGGDVDYCYYSVSVSGERVYSDPVYVTGEIHLATEDAIGGFYNVSDTDLDAGYVYLDDTGHLVLLDYDLLRSGTLAYQLGEDIEVSAGLDAESIQEYLDDYVNDRIAFPNSTQIANASIPNVINITISPAEEDDDTTINIFNIDSRFNASIYIHINGDAGSNCTINIADCEKVRIDSNISGTPVINLYRSCLYYDATVIDYLNTIENMTLWYEQYDETDPNLIVDNMTVRECDAAIITDDIDYWNYSTPDDNHFMFALQSLTFGPDGNIVGANMYIRNETTYNISEGDYVITSTFSLPQGAGLAYPVKRMTKQIKFTGTFVNAYVTYSPVGYMVLDTNFSALSSSYDKYTGDTYIQGSIAFHVRATQVTNITGMEPETPIDVWESNAFHVFSGSIIG